MATKTFGLRAPGGPKGLRDLYSGLDQVLTQVEVGRPDPCLTSSGSGAGQRGFENRVVCSCLALVSSLVADLTPQK